MATGSGESTLDDRKIRALEPCLGVYRIGVESRTGSSVVETETVLSTIEGIAGCLDGVLHLSELVDRSRDRPCCD